jgi:hypothetical protein
LERDKIRLEPALPEKWFGRFWPSRSPTVREGSRSKFWQKPEPLTRGLLLGRTQPIDTFRARPLEPSKLIAPLGTTETVASVRVRRGQQFFRQTVLNSYGVRCCISGINVPRLLIASHIKPSRDFPKERLDPLPGARSLARSPPLAVLTRAGETPAVPVLPDRNIFLVII